MKQYNVGIIGATGMVGQRFIELLSDHPWFNIKLLAASPRSAGKTYADAVSGRWAMKGGIPENVRNLVLYDAAGDVEKIAEAVDFVFCAVDMKKDDIMALEERYAKAECPVVSNNSAHRHTPDVPMIIPEINPQHLDIIPYQRKRLGTSRGFIAVKSNCSLQSYLPALAVINEKYPVDRAIVTTYQAISGAGKTFETWPEMVDNLIPYIGGEEMKSEVEPNKILGSIKNGEIVPSSEMQIECQTYRVPVSDGHTAAIFFSFKDGSSKPSVGEIEDMWRAFEGEPQKLGLPHAPKQFIHVYTEDDTPDMPQIASARETDGGMAISCGRLRKSTQFDYKMVSMSHNTLRGAAGGAVLLAELLASKGWLD
ncbi:MAG TPA: aspartate-semialdehyde dehydrogenase [Candidatus Monoglobus merdigallinarum]|uniref:Aspartate-semialdehyde dehydrogenase n=1 Tax=Candidatus Monoglobus merdigallinarum TaxID=2838698 RepID=A0A9D1PQT2_9FIRM|nr:aspartate-semialdehyde dehydrogenase [Candidatus Monoglobus merdigallinarum]